MPLRIASRQARFVNSECRLEPTTAAGLFGEITVSAFTLWQVLLLLGLTPPLAIWAGHALGRRRRTRLLAEGMGVEPFLSDATLGAFMALLGLLLAFTFGNALTVAQSIKGSITDEAAVIGTAFLRADYLEEPVRTAGLWALARCAEGHFDHQDR